MFNLELMLNVLIGIGMGILIMFAFAILAIFVAALIKTVMNSFKGTKNE